MFELTESRRAQRPFKSANHKLDLSDSSNVCHANQNKRVPFYLRLRLLHSPQSAQEGTLQGDPRVKLINLCKTNTYPTADNGDRTATESINNGDITRHTWIDLETSKEIPIHSE